MNIEKYTMQIAVLIYLQNIIIILHAGFVQDKLLTAKPIHVVRLDGACLGKNVPFQAFVHGIKCNTKSVSIANYTLIAKENLPDKLMLTITISRCRSRENLDSCEEFYKQSHIDYCQSINPDTMLPNPLLIPVEPKFKCPIKKGTYKACNLTYNLIPFVFFDVEEWYWKAHVELFSANRNRLILCVYAEGYVEHKSNT